MSTTEVVEMVGGGDEDVLDDLYKEWQKAEESLSQVLLRRDVGTMSPQDEVESTQMEKAAVDRLEELGKKIEERVKFTKEINRCKVVLEDAKKSQKMIQVAKRMMERFCTKLIQSNSARLCDVAMWLYECRKEKGSIFMEFELPTGVEKAIKWMGRKREAYKFR